MLLKINHTTRYSYDQPVDYALQKVRLRPQANALQTPKAWEIEVTGGKIETGYTDHYGNLVDLVSLTPGGQELAITAVGEVETHDLSGMLGPVYGRAPLWHFLQATAQTQPGPRIKTLAKIVEGDLLSALHALSKSILDAAPYTLGETHSHTTAEEALAGQTGVCQDHAQIFVAAARAAGVPARYVSGYLMMTDRVDQDASHAWAEAHIDGLGWVGFDVSNGISPDEKYVRLAIGRDARDAAPIEGLRIGSAGEEMIVSLQVQQ
ncbi:transglutaminase-like putative cysteine protease [Litoreibacter ponti]|uniref:Transglutaminase-like putative cysteine protease n=1 Tax=Litoreibacter ponti TaxID=1510457 RepID=A0A2T6BMU9_9RHOB|nr:transglutaminase family protein [Litoreibacter ponti]PTX57386.1 transglutaminase-like putative cysteine protease [Litoreibacter ponti]